MTIPANPLRIQRLTAKDASRWDAFVERLPEATFFHRAGWKEVLERAFGHSAPYLFAESEGEILGVLPLGHVRSRLFGNGLVSTPFCVYGGSVGVSAEVCDRLDAEACRLAEELRVDHLELRNRAQRHDDWPRKELYVTFRKTLDPDPEQNLLAIPRKQRAMVRKGIQAGLVSRLDHEVDSVHRIYSESVRNLGTPVFSNRYFRILKEVFGDDCEALTVHHGDKVVAGVLNFYFRDEVLPYYGGGTAEARRPEGQRFHVLGSDAPGLRAGLRVIRFRAQQTGHGLLRFQAELGIRATAHEL